MQCGNVQTVRDDKSLKVKTVVKAFKNHSTKVHGVIVFSTKGRRMCVTQRRKTLKSKEATPLILNQGPK